ncbi:uncharacterized protein LOC128253692 [Drosophila gunungcola]|uniref:Uncharacterized protein n=1 Tax=Drosophila gunungcola TaxID=103775 RepID=A0A9P9YM39_9MUSC|nr:uncharacterized protein LOC128253692 [Drosophila gunungcola]KAI8039498.1 hypothetical protein M5D96_006909 [Drosophila gunungcola]
MSSWSGFLCFLCILVINNLLLESLAMDSEIVEAETGALNAADPNEAMHISLEEMWSPNGAMQVQPYNILEANCPLGYVLANKHCHKRA